MLDLLEEVVLLFYSRNENRLIGVGKLKVETDIYSLTSSLYKSGDRRFFSQSVANRLNIPIGKTLFCTQKTKVFLKI
jgi:hypothetical protein